MPCLVFCGLGLAAAGMIYYATRWGPWAFSDATGYITAARNMVAGHGIGAFDPAGKFSHGVSHPPLYVMALGAISLLGAEPLQSARALDWLLFGMLVGGCGWLAWRVLGSRGSGLAFAVLLMLHPALIIAYTSAMAEPPFILLGLLSLLLITAYLRWPRRVWFLAAAMAAGGALLSRYPGAGYVLTGAGAIALWGRSAPKERLVRAGTFSAIGALPVGIFLLWSATLSGTEGPRALGGELQLLPGLQQFGRSAAAAIWSWKPIPPAVLLPDWLAELGAPGLVTTSLAAAGSLAALLLIYGSVRSSPAGGRTAHATSPAGTLLKVFALFVVTYLGFFLAAYLATDPTPDVDSRTLLPVLPALLGMTIAFVQVTAGAWKVKPVLRIGWIALLVAASAGYAVISRDIVTGLHRTGLGYTGRDWRGSPAVAAVLQIPHELALISNEPSALLLLTGRTPYSIPEIAQQSPAVEFTAYGSGSSEAERALRSGRARLVLFESIQIQLRSLYGDRSEERYEAFISGLVLLVETEDGAIYAYPAGSGDS